MDLIAEFIISLEEVPVLSVNHLVESLAFLDKQSLLTLALSVLDLRLQPLDDLVELLIVPQKEFHVRLHFPLPLPEIVVLLSQELYLLR